MMRGAALICSLSLAAALHPAAGIIAAPSARELERVVPQLISDGDSVLCAGLALASQIEMLKRLAGRVVSVDVPPGMTVVGTNNLLDPAKLAARVREAPDVWAFDPELHLVAPDSDAGAAAWHGGKGVGSKGGGRKETS